MIKYIVKEGEKKVGELFVDWHSAAVGTLDQPLIDRMIKGREDTSISVIIELASGADDEVRREVKRLCEKREQDHSVAVIGALPVITGTLCRATLREAAHHVQVKRIFYDYDVRAYLDTAVPAVRADEAHAQWEATGSGMAIAIVDTGVAAHDDLSKPDHRIVGFRDFVNGREEPYDDHGHGTHVAGIAAGNGYASDGTYVGAAPEADVVGVKVLDASGAGRASTILKGIDWCIREKETHNIRVLNLSLGGPATEPYTDDPLSKMVEQAWHSGIIVCAAAGNEGPDRGTIGTPGFNPSIITVGATDDRNTESPADDREADFSGRGPTVDKLNKPDVLAPGEKIISLLANQSALGEQVLRNKLSVPHEGYVELSGTSMSTPLVAGMAALLLQHNDALSPNDVKVILKSAAQYLEGSRSGYVNTVNALKLAETYVQTETG